jgi:hypothetical protein
MNIVHTYTLVLKVTAHHTSDEIHNMVYHRLGPALAKDVNAVLARYSPECNEAIVLVHTVNDSSSIARVFASWMGEGPFKAPYPVGSLLWYR